MLQKQKSPVFWIFAFFLFAVMKHLTAAPSANEILTNAANVLSLSAAEAKREIPVSIKGVVTAAETNWNGKFFVQDATAGVFVDNKGNPQPMPGDLVQVWGVSHPGGYAPIIGKPHWKKLGTAPLPKAKPVTIEQLMSGSEDSQRVEISGIVRDARAEGSKCMIELAVGGYRIRAWPPIGQSINPEALIGAKVSIKGTAAASFNAPLRHFITVVMFVPRASDFSVEEPAASNPFDEPLTPLNGIAQYRRNSLLVNRVHVKGVVTYQRKGEDVFLQDSTGGLQVKSSQNMDFFPGEVVEAVGFPGVENYLPVLEDAVFKQTSQSRTNLIPEPVTAADLLKGLYHGDFVSLKGKLIDRWIRRTELPFRNPNGIKTILVLQTTNLVFTAEKETTEQNSSLASIPIGSLIKVSGISFLQSDEDGKIKSVQILLPKSSDVQILSRPGWFTPQHLLTTLAIISALLVLVISWSVMISKRNSFLNYLVTEKEEAQKELQEAHDQLDERVKERTAQLKFEMTARKESEVQFKAILNERTRLAQELHDTLEQTMTGIALQLDTTAKLFNKSPNGANYHLELARNLMRQSQVDLRRSVWDLRSRALEQFNLATALLTSSRQLVDGTGIQVEIESKGITAALPEIVEENLLRIGQEALSNVVKHSKAGSAKIELEHGEQKVVLQVKDDGIGFTPGNHAGPNEGHFGLLGITERTKRLGGSLAITTAPGEGTIIRVEIPFVTAPPVTSLSPVEA
jgi:signal transduction histidine kinase